MTSRRILRQNLESKITDLTLADSSSFGQCSLIRTNILVLLVRKFKVSSRILTYKEIHLNPENVDYEEALFLSEIIRN